MLRQKIVQKLTNTPNLGLLPKNEEENKKNFKFGIFGFGYKPKHKEFRLEALSTKNQYKNSCGWNATTGEKEPDENCLLDTRIIVCFGKREGKISGDGFSSLKGNEEILKNFGVGEEGLITRSYKDWKQYSDTSLLTQKVIQNAYSHRSDSYWEVERLAEVYKALDGGRRVKIGIDWYTGYNMNNGFKKPWIIEKEVGMRVGGHALYLLGYIKDYHGRKVFIVKNSFGKHWGDNGNFYITEDMLIKNISKYGAFVNLDVKSDIGKILMEMDGKNVKAKGESNIYHLQNGFKKPYPNWISFLSWGGKEKGFEEVDKRVLDEIPTGNYMELEKTIYWDFLKNVKEDDQLDKLLEIILKK